MESPTPSSIEAVFLGRPAPLAIYQAFLRFIQPIGPVQVAATKTQVSFGAKRKFAWLWLPQRWTHNRPEDSVVLTFALDRRVAHPRIAEAVEPRPGRWTHHIVIQAATDLDADVLIWLREAYALAAGARKRGNSA
jgi:hypothetical protein